LGKRLDKREATAAASDSPFQRTTSGEYINIAVACMGRLSLYYKAGSRWESFPLEIIARYYVVGHHQIANAIYLDKGDDIFAREKI
jgi:hypothetical protein